MKDLLFKLRTLPLVIRITISIALFASVWIVLELIMGNSNYTGNLAKAENESNIELVAIFISSPIALILCRKNSVKK